MAGRRTRFFQLTKKRLKNAGGLPNRGWKRCRDGKNGAKNYTASFILPSQEAALSIICKHLLPAYLKKHYVDYARFRTHKIVSLESVNYTPDKSVLQMAFDDMSVKDLSDFCILRQILIDPYRHSNLEKVREEIRRIWENKVAQSKHDRKSGKEKEDKEVDDLLAMNKLKHDSNPEISVGAQTIAANLKKGNPIKLDVDSPLPNMGPITDPVDDPLVPAAEEDLLG